MNRSAIVQFAWFVARLAHAGLVAIAALLILLVHFRPTAAILSQQAASDAYIVMASESGLQFEATRLTLFWPSLNHIEELTQESAVAWFKEPEFGWDIDWPGFKLRLAEYPAKSFNLRVSPYLVLLTLIAPWFFFRLRGTNRRPSSETDEQSSLPLADTTPEP